MSYLFLFIGVLYSLIFILFYKTQDTYFFSFSGSLIIEIIAYFTISLFLFLYFLNKNTKKDEKQIKTSNFKIVLNKKQIVNLVQRFSYHFGFILFYISLSIFSYFLKINFSFFILFVNLIIVFFFFISKKSTISKDFLRINSNLFSFFYIILFLYIFISGKNILGIVDIINSFLIFVSFFIPLYFDKYLKNKYYSDFNLAYFLIYIFFVFVFFSNIYLFSFPHSILFLLSIFSIFYSYINFDYFTKLKIFKKDIIILRFISILFLYFGLVNSLVFLIFFGFNLFILTALFFSIILNYYYHNCLENYLSFILAIFSSFFLVYFLLFYYNSLSFFTGILFFIINFLLSFGLILISYKIKFKYLYDHYIIIFSSYFLNIVGVFIYLIFNFDILNLGIILFLDSIYFFISYYKIKNIKTYFLK